MRLSQCNRKPHNARVEKIMSTTNDTSGELTRNELDAVLQDDELDAASGGLYVNPITGILFGVVLPAVKSLLGP